MIKEQGAFRTIGELSKELGIKPHILRYWEEQFPMLAPLKRAGARRHYRPDDVAMVKLINRLLNEEGYTIRGARKFLSSQHKRPEMAENVPQAVSAALPMAENMQEDNGLILAELRSIRDRLSQALCQA
jgi:DNA-binding transcriptional MerR regulator